MHTREQATPNSQPLDDARGCPERVEGQHWSLNQLPRGRFVSLGVGSWSRVRRWGLTASTLIPLLVVTACGESANGDASATPPAPAAIQIGQENVVKVESGTIVVGPIISGELRPEREATVRAELGGSMLQVLFEEGQSVRKGALMGRIETRTLEDARRSAESAVRNAESQLAVARREVERTEKLVNAGAIAARDLDLVKSNVTAVEAQLADASARLASAERQLGDAVIRAPIGGIVSRKSVNVGDVVSPGTELFTVIDPSSMRLEASVPSEDLSPLRLGAEVEFTVRGYDQTFDGRIERIAPQADPTTRQVPIFVAIPNDGGRLVAGLFAEGRVVAQRESGLVVPVNAVNTSTQTPWVLRVTNGKTERVNVTLGLRDPRTERVLVASGLGADDSLLRGASQGITPGTSVQLSGR
jgi:membrane fusion protein, multidrug efflux system